MPENYFDERIAKSYEQKWPELFEPAVLESTVDFLADLADSESALEFGVGTGRVAIPLSRRCSNIHGIELSPDMLAELRRQPDSERIGVTLGDFASTTVGRRFRLVYLILNTITNLTTQEQQVDCFRNAAAHLEPGGRFLIEVYIPHLRRLPPGQTVYPFSVTSSHVGLEEYDFATQVAFSHHYWMNDGQVETFSAPFRYVWPSELDLMARLAGMELRERWADWSREPFTNDSLKHISVWEKPCSDSDA
jgi:SAM-dependent methyltransferase